MAAMIYAQSRSEMQTIISMPLDLEYNANSHQQNRVEGIHQLLQEGSNGLCHQLDGSVICNVIKIDCTPRYCFIDVFIFSNIQSLEWELVTLSSSSSNPVTGC